VEWDGNKPVLMMRLTEHPTVILRHTGADTGDPAAARRFDRELYRLQGLPYADWPKLLNALPDDHPARPLVNMIQPGEGARELLEGRFCSKCVAETYGAMGWTLPDISLARVSPNDLWRLRMPQGPLEVREELIVAPDDGRLQQRAEAWEKALGDLRQQFPAGRFGLDEMLKFKMEMSTIASRQHSAVTMFEQVFLDQIELRRGTEQAVEIPKLQEALEKLRETAARGQASARSLGLNLPQ